MMYDVFYIGGEKDGITLATFDDERDAIMFAEKYYAEHNEEFDPCWGGVSIVDEKGSLVEW